MKIILFTSLRSEEYTKSMTVECPICRSPVKGETIECAGCKNFLDKSCIGDMYDARCPLCRKDMSEQLTPTTLEKIENKRKKKYTFAETTPIRRRRSVVVFNRTLPPRRRLFE